MEWSGEGMVVSNRQHGETSAIVEVLTRDHGRHAGVVRGGTSRKMAPVLQPGTQVAVTWRARLEEHIGAFVIEPIKSRSSILSDRMALAGFTSLCSLICFSLPDRMELPSLYDATIDLADRIESGETWVGHYVRWEVLLLEELGYALNLSECTVTGSLQELIYVSPRSGSAVSRKGAGQWADKLLPLSPVLLDEADDISGTITGMFTTGYFLENFLAKGLGNRPIPQARTRLVDALERQLRKDMPDA
jgi:DNA repair protein RecO (recombination protein O)